MFEVGFTEIILIMGLALLVLGPEKLPKLAAQLGRWTGRARSMARQLRAQLDQEVNFQEQRATHGRGETPRANTPPAQTPEQPESPASAPDAAVPDGVSSAASNASGDDPFLKSGNE